jgi:hypothetical protein
MVALAALLLIAACGGPENQEPNTEGQSSSSISSGQEQGPSGGNNGSTISNQTPQEAADGSSGQSSQVSTTGGQSSAVVPSGTAARINDDLEPALEQALGVGLIVEEVQDYTDQGGNEVSITYTINEDLLQGELIYSAKADLLVKISGALESLGANIANAIASGNGLSFGFQGLEAGGVTAYGTAHYAYYNPSHNEIQFNLTVISGLSAPSAAQTPAPTSTAAASSVPSEPFPTQTPAPAPTSTVAATSEASEPPPTQAANPASQVDPVVASATAGRISDELKPALEKALGVELTVVRAEEASGNSAEIRYRVNGAQPITDDLLAKISGVLEGLGANISNVNKLGIASQHAVEGLKVGGVTADGMVMYHYFGSGDTLLVVRLSFAGAAVVPAGLAGRFNDDLAPALEAALGVNLAVARVREDTSWAYDGNFHHNTTIEYQIDEDLPPSDGLAAEFSEAFESLGGNVTVTGLGLGVIVFEAEGFQARGVTGNANIQYVYRHGPPVPNSIIFGISVPSGP